MTGVVIDCHGTNAEFHFHMAFWHFLLSEEYTVTLLRPDVATAKEYVRCVYKVRCSPIHKHNDARAQHTHPPTHTHTHIHASTSAHTHARTHAHTYTAPHHTCVRACVGVGRRSGAFSTYSRTAHN